MTSQSALFGVLAVCAVVSALGVVRSKDLVHAVVWLAATLIATAALYAALGASFLAGVQALVYAGGVITLVLFGVMITRRHDGNVVSAESSGKVRAALVSAAFFGTVAWAVRATPGLDRPLEAPLVNTADLGRSLLVDHVLAFEAASLLLLASMIGAVVIARRRDVPKPARTTAAAATEGASR
jgi:NADH-quinone oxidoreductase subunit J